VRVPGENPAAMLPWFDGILMEPAPYGAPADGSGQAGLSGVGGNIVTAPAGKGNVIGSQQLTGDCFNLNNDLCGGKDRGRPGRERSSRPSRRYSKKRFRHMQTTSRRVSNLAAM